MELFVKVYFWFGVGVFICKIVQPDRDWETRSRQPETIGNFLAELLVGLAVTIWAGLVLWGSS